MKLHNLDYKTKVSYLQTRLKLERRLNEIAEAFNSGDLYLPEEKVPAELRDLYNEYHDIKDVALVVLEVVTRGKCRAR